MKTKLQKQEKGFTIIEVLIVLAIAGLIILIVFLAVPALQRNNRNTQRKTDSGHILSGVNEWSTNNGNKYSDATSAAAPAPADRAAALGNSSGKFAFYKPANVTWKTGTQANATTKDTAVIVTDAKCSGAGTTQSDKSLAVMYSVETGGGTQAVCLES